MKTQNTKHKTQNRAILLFALLSALCLTPYALTAQPTISPAIAFGTYKHYTTSSAKPTAMLNINAGYKFKLKTQNPQLITELNILVPLENDHPVSFSLQAGAHIQLTEMLSIIIAAGPEVHIQQLYKYPIDAKDTPYRLQKPTQFSAKLRILKSISQDANTKLYTEISYDQHMPLLKFGMYITITKKY
jgi:hypothetical protein